MSKLTYKKVNDNLITIDLHNGYTIIAIISWNSDEHNYDVQLRIKENTVNMWDLIEKAEHLTFNTNYKFIYKTVLKQVATFLKEGFFDYYIDRYEYECKCFDKGNDYYETNKRGYA